MPDSASHWDTLHANPRFRPSYPNENVVRFLIALRNSGNGKIPLRMLDVGMGAGRHTKLAAELGFHALAVDTSLTGLRYAREQLRERRLIHSLAQASMLALPFRNASFDAVVSFGVFYYATAARMKTAIAEAYRVLVPGGSAFVVLRTVNDYRCGKGEELEHGTFRLEIDDTNEYGTIQHFLDAGDVPVYFSEFSHVTFEKTETTFANRESVNSDWLITAQK